ncbi:MAG TPA: hypothetical protein VJ954_08515, partial [Ignavibacteriaceae bacterium]|nr:hypothetical protein [Ignavibacteriaceae bacterium]
MKNLPTIFLIILFIFSCSFAQKKVYLAHIESEIEPGLAPYITRVVNEAEKNNASAIIFKINTLGGRVDAAVQIVD